MLPESQPAQMRERHRRLDAHSAKTTRVARFDVLTHEAAERRDVFRHTDFGVVCLVAGPAEDDAVGGGVEVLLRVGGVQECDGGRVFCAVKLFEGAAVD